MLWETLPISVRKTQGPVEAIRGFSADGPVLLGGRDIYGKGRENPLIKERARKARWGTQPNLCGFLFLTVPRIRARPRWGGPRWVLARQSKQSFGAVIPLPMWPESSGVRWGKCWCSLHPSNQETDAK